MKYFKTDLSLAASKDDLREQMQFIIFVDGYAIATDGNILIKQDLALHGFTDEDKALMNGKALHRDAFKEIFKYKDIEVEAGTLVCKKGRVKIKIDLEDIPSNYPKYEAVIPNATTKKEAFDLIGVNLNLFETARKLTVNSEKRVSLEFWGADKPIIATGRGLQRKEELIIIMPFMID